MEFIVIDIGGQAPCLDRSLHSVSGELRIAAIHRTELFHTKLSIHKNIFTRVTQLVQVLQHGDDHGRASANQDFVRLRLLGRRDHGRYHVSINVAISAPFQLSKSTPSFMV